MPSLLVLLAFASLCACDAISDDAETVACDPLAPHPQPIALGKVLGVGKDSESVYYVVDEADGDQRVFVSDGDVLERQRVAGSGSSSDESRTLFSFGITDHDPVFTLEVMQSDGETRMGVFTGELETKTFTIGEQGEELTVVPEDEIADKTLRNLAGDVFVEYADRLDDGRVLVVTRPSDDWSYEDFRLFLGPLADVEERVVHNVTRALDGGSTTIELELDGASATAMFPVMFRDNDTMFAPGTPTLEVDGETQALTRLDGPPANADYSCLSR